MKKEGKQVAKSLIMVSQVGVSMLTPIFLCVFAGAYIDKLLCTSYWFIILVLFGIFAAFRNVYVLMKKFYEKDLKREQEEQKYFKNLQNEYERNQNSIKSKKSKEK